MSFPEPICNQPDCHNILTPDEEEAGICAHHPGVEVHRLVGYGDFDDLADQIKARLFGHLARLAAPVVIEYHSDLYRDAQWVEQNITGPCDLDFVVRQHGTFLGKVGAELNMARTYIQSTSSHADVDRFYYLSLTVVDREWLLTIRRNR